MSTLGWTGRTLRIALNGEVLAAVRAKTVAYANPPIDITEGERNGWRRFAERGEGKAIEVSCDGICTEVNWPVLHAFWLSDEFATLTVLLPDGTAQTADAFLSGLSRGGEHSGAVTFSATFLLSGISEPGNFWTSEPYPPIPDEPPPGIVCESNMGIMPAAGGGGGIGFRNPAFDGTPYGEFVGFWSPIMTNPPYRVNIVEIVQLPDGTQQVTIDGIEDFPNFGPFTEINGVPCFIFWLDPPDVLDTYRFRYTFPPDVMSDGPYFGDLTTPYCIGFYGCT